MVRDLNKVAFDSWNDFSLLAQSAWEATVLASNSDYHMLEDPVQSIPKAYTGHSNGYCDQWLKA